MTRTAILADDLTGALDGASSFLPAVFVTATSPASWAEALGDIGADGVAVNLATRHLPADEAYRQVFSHMSELSPLVEWRVFKKTDSVLRGNVGSELQAALDASGLPRLHFLPALPSMGRTTENGIHRVDGVPVSDGPFGADPFDPVPTSSVVELIQSQADVPVTLVPEGAAAPREGRGIVVYDATSQEALDARLAELVARGEDRLIAGCLGAAQALARALGYPEAPLIPRPSGHLLVGCGTVNPVSAAQCVAAREGGARTFEIGAFEKCDPVWLDRPYGAAFLDRVAVSWKRWPLTLIDASRRLDLEPFLGQENDPRQTVADNIGRVLAEVCAQGADGWLLVTGGDVLASFLAEAQIPLLRPLGSVAPGVVLSQARLPQGDVLLASKSGGYGPPDLFLSLAGVPPSSASSSPNPTMREADQ